MFKIASKFRKCQKKKKKKKKKKLASKKNTYENLAINCPY